MKKGVFKAKTETGIIVDIVATREEIEVRTRAGVQLVPGLIELFCTDFGCHVNADESDPTRSRFTLVFPPLKVVRLEDSPFPEI